MNLTTSPELAFESTDCDWPERQTAPDRSDFMDEVLAGLSASHRAIPCRFLYDAAGSELFDRICLLPEYYPTRTERQILSGHATDIAAAIGQDVRFIELGAGSGGKAELLLDAMPGARSYVCIDISPVPLANAAAGVRARYPGLDVSHVCGNYLGALDVPSGGGLRDVCFFPGSTIGNFEREDAQAFLAQWRERLGPAGMMLIGVDLKKDAGVLERAYDDAQGITAQFSLNLLRRANCELGANFNLEAFRHRARYIGNPGHIEITLVSRADQSVRVGGRQFRFAEGDAIHVENSHKYAVPEFAALAEKAGFASAGVWTDADELFSVHLLRAAG